MLETDIVSLIGNVGFPIAISLYLLITRDKIITSNTEAINKLVLLIESGYFKKE